MKEKIYLHTSDYENIRKLNEDSSFQCPFEYDAYEYSKIHQYEYGRIKTRNNDFHILVGQMRQENCPWCAGECVPLQTSKGSYFRPSSYCMQCSKCGSRGPVLQVNESMLLDTKVRECVLQLLKQKFEIRKQWDYDLLKEKVDE